MRFLRTLLAAFALTASVAACGDAPSPTAADDVAPRQGRMLKPGQASMVKPGDFIIYRPEEYARFGISTFAAPGTTPTAYREYYEQCQLTINGPSPACCEDPSSQWYSWCPQPDPCYDQWGSPTYSYGCQYPVEAVFTYGSSAPYDGEVNNGGIVLKQLRLISFSQAIANVASSTVDAAFKNVGAAGGAGCNNVPQAFDNAHASASGSPAYIEVSRVAQWLGTVKWQVDGVHSFTPASGASGGGTFYSTAGFCG